MKALIVRLVVVLLLGFALSARIIKREREPRAELERCAKIVDTEGESLAGADGAVN